MHKTFMTLALAGTVLAGAGTASAQGWTQPAATDWTGVYGGGSVGYGTADGDVDTTGQAPANVANVAGGARPASTSLDTEGFLGGANVGYNWQQGSLVYGFETDIAYADINDDRTVTTTALNGIDQLDNHFEQNLDYLGTVRGRLGYAYESTLFYGTAGMAYGKVDNKARFEGPAGQTQFVGSDDETKVGYTVGGGVEQKIGNQWSANLGYLYYDLGSDDANVAVVPGSGGGGTGYNSDFDNSGHIVRVGFNYHFN